MSDKQASGGEKSRPPPQSAFEVDSVELAKKRQGYYDGWRALAKEEVEKTKEQEELEKAQAAEKLGLKKDEPKSEAEKKDREKHEMLKDAKKRWEGKQAQEEQMKYTMSDQKDVMKTLTKEDTSHRPVLVFSKLENCHISLGDQLGTLIKLFISDCANTTIDIGCMLITQHVEISHCENMTINVTLPMETIQVDLCDGIVVKYSQNCLLEGNKLYHAGVKRLVVHHFDVASVEHDYTDLEPEDDHAPLEERQFVTHLKNDRLVTERVRRASGMMPLTDDELAKVAEADEIATAHLRQARDKRTAGNEAFQEGNYMQAGVFYTQAMGLAPNDKEILCICLSNRAACNLKLGRLEEALEDADACIALNDKFVKGWFRKGIALHALKRFGLAIQALVKADELEPRNKQIQEAIGFAKIMHDKQMRELQEKYA